MKHLTTITIIVLGLSNIVMLNIAMGYRKSAIVILDTFHAFLAKHHPNEYQIIQSKKEK